MLGVFLEKLVKNVTIIFVDMNIFPILCERWGRKQLYILNHKSLW